MKDRKSKSLILAFSVVALLILSSVGTFGATVDSTNEDNLQSVGFKIKSSAISVKMNSQSTKSSTVNINGNGLNTLDIGSFNNSENIAITNTSLGNESYPSMVVSGYDALVAYEYQNGDDPYIHLSSSSDFGQSWPNSQKLEITLDNVEITVNSPSLCVSPFDDHAYGTFFSSVKNSGLFGNLDISDISDIEDATKTIWDFSEINDPGTGDYLGSFWGFSHPDIEYHHKQGVPWISSYIGSTNYSDDTGDHSAENTLMLSYLDSDEPITLWLQWDPKIEFCSNISIATDNTFKTLYGVCEKENGTKQDLLFFKGSHKTGTDGPYIDLEYYNFSTDLDHGHPKIYVKDNDIYIASEFEEAGLDDILIYHSSNGNDSWDTFYPTGTIRPPPEEFVPKYPTVYANETEIFCTYIEDRNLTLTLSDDSGANWTDPIQINSVNDSVVEEYRFSEMISDNHIVWIDDRNGNTDIYCIIQGIPEFNLGIISESLKLEKTEFQRLQTNNYVTFAIQNIGELYVEDVLIEVTVNRTGKPPLKTDYPGFIKHLENGTELSFKEPLFRITVKEFIGALLAYIGIDHITIEIIPSGTFPDTDPSDNIDSIDVKFSDIFPFFSIFDG